MTAIFAARHDRLIIRMIEEGRIVVEETPAEALFDNTGEPARPVDTILARDQRTGRLARAAISFTGFGGAPRFRTCIVATREGEKSQTIWLSARRVVWLSYHRKPSMYMIVPIDKDQRNYNIWNLCERDQGAQKYHQILRQGEPEPEADQAYGEGWPI